jgi:hypothetical protein
LRVALLSPSEPSARSWWRRYVSGGWLLALGLGLMAAVAFSLLVAPRWTVLVICAYLYTVFELALWGVLAPDEGREGPPA